MSKPHKHRDVIIAYAEGADVQYKHKGEWEDVKTPCFSDSIEYRIKPKILKKEGWVNIYPTHTEKHKTLYSGIYDSEAAANMDRLSDRIACIRIEWEEEV